MKRMWSHLVFFPKFSFFLLGLTHISCTSGKFHFFNSGTGETKTVQTLDSINLDNLFDQQDIQKNNLPIVEQEEALTELELDLASARIADHWFSYKVTKGDTLGKISRQYHVTTNALRKANKIRGNKIYVGQHLIIPSVSKNSSYTSDVELASIWDYELAEQLAKESYLFGSKRSSTGRCLMGVRIALTRSMQKLGLLPGRTRLHMGRSAHLFKSWAINNVELLCTKYKLVPIVGNSSRPSFPGLIYVYHRGRCGFSKRYGHVETIVAANPTMACSDNCRIIKDHSCKPDLILAPCKYCPETGLSKN